MFEEDDEEYLEIVTLTGDDGDSYSFQVIEEIELNNQTYLITIPEDNYDDQGELIIIKDQDSLLTIVEDMQIIEQIQKILEDSTIDNEDIRSITLLGNDGKKYDYDVVERIFIDEKEYIFTVDIDSSENKFVIFEVKDLQLNMIEDGDLYIQLMDSFNNRQDYRFYTSGYDYEETKITLQDENDHLVELNILGKLDIKGNNYLIGSDVNNKLVAILINGEHITLIKDPAIVKEVDYYLHKIREVISGKTNPHPNLN